jgi:hypothetical protein
MNNDSTLRTDSSSLSRRSHFLLSYWWILIQLAYACLLLWPLMGRLTTHLPTVDGTCATVPLFNVWTIWWNAESALSLFSNYLNAPMFGGSNDAFVYSEVQPITLVVAPVIWLTGSRVLAYNIYLLLCLTLNGIATTLLLKDFKLSFPIAVVGGMLMQGLPLVHWQLDVLQMVPIWGLLWVILSVFRYFDKPSIKRGLLLGLAFSVNYFLNNHYGYFAILLIPIASIWLINFRHLRHRTFWLGLVGCFLVTAILLLPLLLKQVEVANRFADQRSPLTRLNLSAHLVDFANAYGLQAVNFKPFEDPARVPHWFLGLGTFRTGLGLVGIFIGICTVRYRRLSLFLLTLTLLGVFFSLGPTARWGNISPYDFLLENLPGLSSIRSVYRFGVLTQICLLLSVLILISRITSYSRWAGVVVTLVVFVEVIPYSTQVAAVPDLASHQPLLGWIQENVGDDQVVLHWPLPKGPSMYDYEVTTEQMYLSMFHKRRLLNGYSAYFPDDYYAVVEAFRENEIDKLIILLNESDVRYIISSGSNAKLGMRDDLQSVFRDRSRQDEVYEVIDESSHKK